MKKGFLVCFIGLDGSGKTSLSQLFIKDVAIKYNIMFEYVWCKFGKYNSLIKKIFNFFIKDRYELNNDFPEKKNIRGYFFKKIYFYFLIINHTIDILIKVTLPTYFGKNIVCDRYLGDTVTDLVMEFGYSYDESVNLINSFPLIKKPEVLIYIQIPENLAYERKKENSIEYLKRKNIIYDQYSVNNKTIILNGKKSIEELSNKVLETFVNRCLNG